MKKFSFILLVIFIAVSCKKEAEIKPPNFILIGGSPLVKNNISIHDPNTGDICFLGHSNGQQAIESVDGAGNSKWIYIVPTTDQLYCIAGNPGSDFFACGRTSKNDLTRLTDVVLIKMHSNGDTVWSKIYGTDEEEEALSMVKTSDGGAIMAGQYSGSSTTGLYLVRINSFGDTVWTKRLPYSETIQAWHLFETKNGEFFLTGSISNVVQKAFFLRFDRDGKTVWTGTGSNLSLGYASIEMADGSMVTCGLSYILAPGQVFIQRMDKSGNILWEKDYGSEADVEEALDIQKNADGSMILTGRINMGFSSQILLLKIDGEGNHLFSRRFNKNNYEMGVNVIKDLNDDNIILGLTDDRSFLLRTDTKGNFK